MFLGYCWLTLSWVQQSAKLIVPFPIAQLTTHSSVAVYLKDRSLAGCLVSPTVPGARPTYPRLLQLAECLLFLLASQGFFLLVQRQVGRWLGVVRICRALEPIQSITLWRNLLQKTLPGCEDVFQIKHLFHIRRQFNLCVLCYDSFESPYFDVRHIPKIFTSQVTVWFLWSISSYCPFWEPAKLYDILTCDINLTYSHKVWHIFRKIFIAFWISLSEWIIFCAEPDI